MDDIPRGQEVTFAALSGLGARMARPVQDLTDEIVMRSPARIAHLLGTDPDNAWAAEVDGVVVGIAQALVREGMWFLSHLMVDPTSQDKRVGRELLDMALTTATDRSWVLSTDDFRAARRFQRAGFALHPSFSATGTADRSRLPAVTGVRDYDDDRETLDTVTRAARGAAMGPEVDYFLERGNRIVVVPGKGFAVLRPVGATWLAATDEQTARDLLWTALAEATAPLEVDWLTADQQWAIDVCLDARLLLRPGASLALRGQPRLVSPYLPCGAFG